MPKRLAIIFFGLIFGVIFIGINFANADTRIINQPAYDSSNLGRWGQRFTLTASTTIQSAAIGRSAGASCGNLQIFKETVSEG